MAFRRVAWIAGSSVALGAVVERPVGVGAVAVLLAVAHVVLDVVRDQVAQREPVVRRDEVDARERPALVAECVRRPCEAGREPAGTDGRR